MRIKTNKFLNAVPLILAFLFTAFISLFALDILTGYYDFWDVILGFLIHLRLTFILVVITLIAWRWKTAGGIIFLTLGLYFLIVMWNNFPIVISLIIPGSLILIGSAFLLNKVIIHPINGADQKRKFVFWVILFAGLLYFLSELIIITRLEKRSLFTFGIPVLIVIAAFVYKYKSESEKLTP